MQAAAPASAGTPSYAARLRMRRERESSESERAQDEAGQKCAWSAKQKFLHCLMRFGQAAYGTAPQAASPYVAAALHRAVAYEVSSTYGLEPAIPQL